MMETLNDFFATLSGYLWGWPMIILLLGTHVYLTFRLGVPQRKLLTAIRLSLSKPRKIYSSGRSIKKSPQPS